MWLYGASGHGKVIKDILEAQGVIVEGFVDDNPDVQELCGLPVLHSAEGLPTVIISIGVNRIRKVIAERLQCEFGVAIHSSASVSPSAQIGEGTVVMPGAVINADAKIGRHCIINTGASIDHECVVDDYCHVAPHATLCGQVHVGEGTLVGVGSSVIPCKKIGRWCVIGAGSAVVSDLSDGSMAYGNPCKQIKLVNEDMIETEYLGGGEKCLTFNGERLTVVDGRREKYAA